MFEESVGVPLLISVPEGANEVRRQIVEHIDLFPTLAKFRGLERVGDIAGRGWRGW